MNSRKETLVVNLLAGPGCGKSTFAAGIFTELKWLGVEVELATEYAKDLVWEKRHETFKNQIYLFGKQHHRIFRLLGQVDVVVTDSPILLSPMYDAEKRKTLFDLVMHEYYKTRNLNIFLQRRKDYNPNGRNHTEKEAKEIDALILRFLTENGIIYQSVCGTKEGVQVVVDQIVRMI